MSQKSELTKSYRVLEFKTHRRILLLYCLEALCIFEESKSESIENRIYFIYERYSNKYIRFERSNPIKYRKEEKEFERRSKAKKESDTNGKKGNYEALTYGENISRCPTRKEFRKKY